MALSNFQYLWNGLTVGAGTDVQIVGEEGLRRVPPVRSDNVAKPRMDGAFAGFNFLDERVAVLTLAMTVTKAAPFETVLSDVTYAFQPTFDPNNEQYLQFLYPGWDSPRQIKCRVTKAGFPTDLDYSFHKISSMPIEFTATDPLIYDSVNQNAEVQLASSGVFPLTTLSASASIGATSLTVTSNSGFVPGMVIYIDATGTEQRTINTIVGTTGITITAGLTTAHSAGAAVSGSSFPALFSLTKLTASVSAGGTSLTVASSAGFYVGQTIFLDTVGNERRVIASIPNGTTISLTVGVTSAHSTDALVWNGLVFGPTSGGALLCNNHGNYPTWPTFTLTGPLTNPRVTLQSTNEFFALNTTLTASDSIVIDMKAGTVYLNGTTTRYNTVVTGSSWFTLPVGASVVQVTSTSPSYENGLFAIDYRSAWSWC
jgi:hypothetical protein